MSETTATQTCARCGNDLPARVHRYANITRWWCSDACRIKTYYAEHPEKAAEQRDRAAEKRREERAAAPTRNPCLNCGTPVHNSRAAYCMAPACRVLAVEADRTRKCAVAKALYDSDKVAGAARINAIRASHTAQQKADGLKSQQRWKAATRTFVSVTCAQCGNVFQAEQKTSDQRRYCSDACGLAATLIKARLRNGPPKPPAPRYIDLPPERRGGVCGVCMTAFVMRSPTHIWCNPGCADRAKRVRDVDPSASVARVASFVAGTCLRCGTNFVDRWLAAGSSRYCSRKCGAGATRDRRRARLHSAFVAEVSRAKIYRRDNWCCGICGLDVDMRASAPEPMSPSLDHIIPIARGGTHEPKNCQLAHFLCNAIKSDRPAVDLELLEAI